MTKNRMRTTMAYVETSKPHFHPDELEIILVLKGSMTIKKVERTLTVREGEFTFINRYIVHSIQSEGAYVLTTKVKLEAFKEEFSRIEYVEFLNNDELLDITRPLKDGLNNMVIELMVTQYCFENHLRGYVDDQEKAFNEKCFVHLLFSFYQLILHLKTEEEYPTNELQDRYYAVVAYVMEHIHEKITVEDILQNLYMNATYFSQFMKKVGGMGFKEFLQYRKIIRVEGYLLDKSLSLTEVANTLSIYDMKSFYTLFKRYFKVAPKVWRDDILQIKDCYHMVFDPIILENFINKYHLNQYRTTSSSRLYKRLLQVKNEHPTQIEGIEIILNPYTDMGKELNHYYRPYKYMIDIIEEVYALKATLHMVFPYQYLSDQEGGQRFINVMKVTLLKVGLNKLRKMKFSLVVQHEKDLRDAQYFKGRVEKALNGIVITIVMELVG